MRAFVDTSVLLHAFGGESPFRHASRELVAQSLGAGSLHVGAEALQEFIFHRLRVSPRDEAISLSRRLAKGLVVHPLDEDVFDDALTIMERSTLRGRDAVLAATAIRAGFTQVVTHDERWPAIAGLQPVSAVEFLTSAS